MKSIEELKSFYASELEPVIDRLEQERKALLRPLWGTITVSTAIAVGGITGFLVSGKPQVAVVCLIVAVLVGVLGYFIFVHSRYGSFTYSFKTKIIGGIVRFIDEKLEYRPDRYIPEGVYMQSTIFQRRPDRYNGEDYVSGKLGETQLEFSEIHSEYKTETRDSKGRRNAQWHTIFRGIFFVADFHKDFIGTTVVLPDFAEKTFGFIGNMFQKWNITREDLVKLEDPEFEKCFVVYGDDQIEARYILSTSMMSRLLDFNKRARQKLARDIFVSFTGSKVFIAMACNKNLFEPRLFGSNRGFGTVLDYFEYLQLATGIVEELNLNTRIWSKE